MDIQLPQILFQIVNFSVVMGALTYLLYKPVRKILEERADQIAKGQKAAEEALAEKNKLGQLEKEAKEQADKQAAQIIEKARQDAKKVEESLEEEAKAKAEKSVAKLKANWEDEKRQHLSDMKREFVNAVVATTEKLLQEKLDEKKHQKLIEAQLDQLLKVL